MLNPFALDNLSTTLELLWYFGLWLRRQLPSGRASIISSRFSWLTQLAMARKRVDVWYLLEAPWELTVYFWTGLAHLWAASKMVLQSCIGWSWWEVSRLTCSPPAYHLPGDQGPIPSLGVRSYGYRCSGGENTTPQPGETSG